MKQSPMQVPYEPFEVEQPPANRRTQSKLRTRQKLLAAARDLFIDRGYEPATVRDIARAAGMSTGAVFANFQDKSDLFEAVQIDDCERAAERMREAAGRDAPVANKLLNVFLANYGYYSNSLPLVRAMQARAWERPADEEGRARPALKALLATISDALRDAARRNEIRQDFDVRLISEMLWDAYLASLRRAIFDAWTVDVLSARLADQISVVLAGLHIRS